MNIYTKEEEKQYKRIFNDLPYTGDYLKSMNKLLNFKIYQFPLPVKNFVEYIKALPEGSEIRAVRMGSYERCMEILIRNDTFEPAIEGSHVPEAHFNIAHVVDKNEKVVGFKVLSWEKDINDRGEISPGVVKVIKEEDLNV